MSAIRIAEALAQARRTGHPVATADLGPAPADEVEAMAVQARIAAEFGPVGGFKTGTREGEPPTMAPILASGIRPSGAALTPADSRLRGVELEIAFRLEAPLPPLDAPDFEARLAAATSILPVIEVIDSRIQDPDAADPLWKAADSYINCGLVLGTPLRDWRGIETSRPVRRLAFDGEIVAEGRTTAPGGDAFRSLVQFARAAGTHCGGLQPGQIVITGTLTGLRYAPPGAAVEGEIDGLGAVSMRFTPTPA